MRHVISASLFVLSWALAQPASAQLEDKPVPMDPFHIPVFSNDYLILLNVNIPPGRNTGYHTHYADSVSVNLTPASQTNQNYGSFEVSAPGTGGEGAPGRTTFTNVTKDGPRTHKATSPSVRTRCAGLCAGRAGFCGKWFASVVKGSWLAMCCNWFS